jgi:hypothetical protein
LSLVETRITLLVSQICRNIPLIDLIVLRESLKLTTLIVLMILTRKLPALIVHPTWRSSSRERALKSLLSDPLLAPHPTAAPPRRRHLSTQNLHEGRSRRGVPPTNPNLPRMVVKQSTPPSREAIGDLEISIGNPLPNPAEELRRAPNRSPRVRRRNCPQLSKKLLHHAVLALSITIDLQINPRAMTSGTQ